MDWRNHGLLCVMTSLCTAAVFDTWKGCVKTSKVHISSVHEGQEHSRRGSSSPLASAGVNVTRLLLLRLFSFLFFSGSFAGGEIDRDGNENLAGSRLYSWTHDKWLNTEGGIVCQTQSRYKTIHHLNTFVPFDVQHLRKQRRILVKALSGSHDSQSALNLTD